VLFLLTSLLIAGCGNRSPATPTPAIFLPPTLAATPTPPPRATATRPPPSPTPPCENNLVFLEDLTIPDGTVTDPGEELDKRWRIQNGGTCNWDDRYQVRLVSGPALGVPTEQALFPARSGTETEVRMLFEAPSEPGVYRSTWQAFSPQGEPFGDPFYVEFAVE
jgi:hypothetical protein